MNITFVVNENYAIYLYVAIKSILKNNKDSSIHFYVFNEYLSEISKSEILKLKKKLNKILSENTNQDLKKIENDTERDYFLSACEALDYGIIDKILK